MKHLSVEIDEKLYEPLLALLRQFPEDRVHILEQTPSSHPQALSFEEAMAHTLDKNAELYKRLA
ncbi:hypothetical protein D5125_03445 [Magnetovirga frankeli]|uniref:hypothetical protein n=1 Tax=Magnetovirga frankeli TaxID=947516 RepID=UPI001293FFBB|nr:hypothetical protein D5125_03445 [gamma proteobacterium SS-5]